MTTLDGQRLDVVNNARNTIFGWRGQFTPELTRN